MSMTGGDKRCFRVCMFACASLVSLVLTVQAAYPGVLINEFLAVNNTDYVDEEKVKAFIILIRPLGIKELVRTGPVAMARGDKVMKVKEKLSQGGEENG